MGFFKRAKQIWNKVRSGGKKVLQKVLKHAPGAINALIKVIEIADGLKIRKLILNAIPEAGGYLNQIVDVILECKQKGVFDKVIELLKQLLEGEIDAQKFVELTKSIISSVSSALGGSNLKEALNKKITGKIPESAAPTKIVKQRLNKLKETKELVPEEISFTKDEEDIEEQVKPTSVFGEPVN